MDLSPEEHEMLALLCMGPLVGDDAAFSRACAHAAAVSSEPPPALVQPSTAPQSVLGLELAGGAPPASAAAPVGWDAAAWQPKPPGLARHLGPATFAAARPNPRLLALPPPPPPPLRVPLPLGARELLARDLARRAAAPAHARRLPPHESTPQSVLGLSLEPSPAELAAMRVAPRATAV